MPRRRDRGIGPALAACLGLFLAACAPGNGAPDAPPPAAGLDLRFEDRPRPDIYRYEGRARIAADGAPGLWVAAPGLAQPERGRLRLPDAGGEAVVVALYALPAGAEAALGPELAARLGLEPGAEARVSVTALRREVVLAVP